MSNIIVTMKDGTVQRFDHVGRAGGSYVKVLKLENGWAIIEDERHNRTAIPAEDIAKIEEKQHRGSW